MDIFAICHNLTKYHGTELIFKDANLEIHNQDRIGIVGRNGSGKTTFCNCIAGKDTEYSGKITISSGIKIGYFRQLYRPYKEKDLQQTVFDYVLKSQTHLLDIEEELNEMMQTVATTPTPQNLSKLGELQYIYEKNEIYSLLDRIEHALTGLGINQNGDGFRTISWDTKLHELSGGERKIVELATIVIKKDINLLILDEPMGHLDIHAREWMENFIKAFQGTVLVVSHDRELLTNSVNKILTIENQELCSYPENYTNYRKLKKEKITNIKRNWKLYEKEKNRMEKHLNEIRDWVLKSGSEKMQRLWTVEKRKYEKFINNEPINPKLFQQTFYIKNNDIKRFGHIAIRFRDFTFKFKNGQLIFNNMSTLSINGDKVGLIGLNGTGKSTLIRIILTKYCHDKQILPSTFGITDFYEEYLKQIISSDIYIGPSVSIGYFDQQHQNIPEQQTIEDYLFKLGYTDKGKLYGIMRQYSLEKGVEHKLIRDLSGGEKARIQLITIENQNPNLLLLDEPVNHLDIDDKEVVHEFLRNFKGNLITISHDRYLLKNVVNKYWKIMENGIIEK